MGGDVLDAFAVNINLAAVAQAFQIFGAGERPAFGLDGVFRFHAASPPVTRESVDECAAYSAAAKALAYGAVNVPETMLSADAASTKQSMRNLGQYGN